MMKLLPTIQGITQAPSVSQGVAFSQPQFMDQATQNTLASSGLDGMKSKKPGIFGQPNVFGGQGPANILPDAQGNVGVNPNGVTNSLFQTPGMDQISQILMLGG